VKRQDLAASCAAIAASVAALAASAAHASSQDRPAPAAARAALEQVIVTASRMPEPLATTLASATVVGRAELDTGQFQTLDEVLATAPGVAVTNNGGVGKISTLFIRGAEADQNLVLVNGVRIGSTTAGIAAIQDIPLDQIERIEIVRGPRSALYGADALGGVVQVLTRKAAEGGWRGQFSMGTGTHETNRLAAGIGARGERGHLQLGASLLESDGTNACQGFGFPLFVGCFTDEPDADAYRNRSASLRGGVTLGTATELEAFALASDGRVEYDGSFGNVAEFGQQALGLAVTQPLGAVTTLRAQLGRATDDSENFSGAAALSRFETTRDSGSLLLDAALREGLLLTAGVDYLRDRVDSTTAYVERSRRSAGVFVQTRWTFAAHDLQFGLRRDDNQQFGGRTTASAAWGWSFAEGWRWTMAAGTGFKAPTFNELYFPGFGNPALDPETSRSVETSLRWNRAAARAALTLFENRIDDLIGFDQNFSPVNIDRTRIRGVEVEGAVALAGWDVSGSVEWLDPINRSAGAFEGNVLPRRAREVLRADVGRQFGPVRLGVRGLYAGERYDNLANTRRLGGYATVDLLAEWQVAPQWRLQARGENVLDRDYATAAFYPQPGREWHLTVRWAPAR
jgi:vitamin B12 transporter